MRPEYMTSDSSNTEQSRYSVTEYFEKYPSSKTEKSANKENRPVVRPQTSYNQHGKQFQPAGDEQPEIDVSRNSTSSTLVENNSMPKVYQERKEQRR